MGYNNTELKGNGSFYTGTGGKVKYTGSLSDDRNQVVAFDAAGGQYKSVDLSEMLNQQNYDFCESLVDSSRPSKRQGGEALKDGDLWWDESSDFTGYVRYEDDWVAIPTGVPVGTIITSVSATEPGGYLRCDGSKVPSGSEYAKLADMLSGNDGELPNLPQGGTNFNYIKF